MAIDYRYTDASKGEIVVRNGQTVTTVPAGHPLFKLLTEGAPARGDDPAVEPVHVVMPRAKAVQRGRRK